MNDFQPPFGGSPFGDSKDYGLEKKQSKLQIGKILKIVIIVIIIGTLIYYLFLNKATLTIIATNTEGNEIPAKISLYKSSSDVSKGAIKQLTTGVPVKLNKRSYYYKINVAGYESKSGTIDLTDDYVQNIELSKNIQLKINNFTIPAENAIAFPGQTILFDLIVENTSASEAYDLNYIVIEKDLNKWSPVFINEIGEELTSYIINPQQSTTLKIQAKIPIDEKIGKKTAKVRIKYTTKSKEVVLDVQKRPDITITVGDMEDITIKSGETKNIQYKIDNSKNNIQINDIKFTLFDINASYNTDVNTWFKIPQNIITVSQKRTEQSVFVIQVPSNARADEITGKLLITSQSLPEPLWFPIHIKIEEPEIKFTSSLNKSSIILTYDENTLKTNSAEVILSLNNQSAIPITLKTITIENATGRPDCNKWITYTIPSKTIDSKKIVPIALSVTLKDGETPGDFPDNTRTCYLKTIYYNPYRETETKEEILLLSITVNKK
ncbi:MAG TPA: hypothetical protein P5513_02435 [Candidatus Diapherotrites archaeon]|nr:hypothetical protein [Candidatus Diapherotrites archaeon]